MNVHIDFADKFGMFSNISDDDLLAFYAWQVSNCYPNEMALVKNYKCEFIAFTDKMKDEFDLSRDIIGKTFRSSTGISDEIISNIHEQELSIIKNRSQQSSFYFYNNKSGVTNSYLVRKRALINPNTGNVIGIMVNTEYYSIPNMMRKFFVSQNQDLQYLISRDTIQEFTYLQKQIILCLIIGINGRKEIAQTISKFLSEDVTEIKVKNTLQQLYRQFGCSDSNHLVNIILSNPFMFDFIEYPISPGNYIIDL
ncbi:MAG: hypothetical protein PHC75_04285 [Burkholderiales bacterium]|nr:hypothetical protein [Burkholderiales bacterium]